MSDDPYFDAEMGYLDSEARDAGRCSALTVVIIVVAAVNVVLGPWFPLSLACVGAAAVLFWRGVRSLKRWRVYTATRPPT